MSAGEKTDDGDLIVEVASPVEKFPVLARLGLGACCLVAALAISAVTLPVLLPEAFIRPSAEKIISRLVGVPVVIDGNVSFRLLPTLDLHASGIRAAGVRPTVRELSIKELELAVDAIGLVRGEVNVEHVVVKEPKVVVAWGLAAPGDGKGGEGAEGAAVDLAWGWWRDMGVSSVALNDGVATLVDHVTARRVDIDGINMKSRPPGKGEPADGFMLDVSMRINGQDASLAATMSDLRLLVSGSRWPARVKLTAPLLTVDFTGSFAARDRMMGVGSFKVSSPDATALGAWIGPLAPLPLVGPLNVAGNVNIVGDRIDARQVRLTAGRTDATADMSINGLLAGQLSVDGRVVARIVDVGRVEIGDAAASLAFDRTPVGRLEFEWDELLIGDNRAGKGRMIVTRAPDRPRVRVELGDSQVFGGTARADITLDAAEGTHALRGTLRLVGADIQVLSGRAADFAPPIKGRMSVDASFLSVGANTTEIMKALQGRIELSATDGILEVPKLVGELVPGKGARFEFHAFNSTIDVSQGVGHTDDIILRAPKLSFVGSGKIDLSTGVAELDVKRVDGEGAANGTKEFRLRGGTDDWSVEAVN